MYQRFFKGYNAFKDHQELKELIEEITDYRHQLKTLNIQDYQVRTIRLSICQLFANFMSSLIRMFLSLWFALPGLLMLTPLATIVAFYAEKERKKALAGSDVKIKATDVMASVKVVSSLVLYPFYCFFFSTAFYKICRNYF